MLDQHHKPSLLDQVRHQIRIKHYSIRTEESYVNVIRSFIRYHNKRHPKEMGAEEIRQYLSHLANNGNVAASTQNVALSALLFLYREVLLIELPLIEGVERAKHPHRIPVVLTVDEVKRVLEGITRTHHLMASLLYGAGLRLMECVRLRVKDLDFEYKQIIVRDGKGEKDRRTIIPEPLIGILRWHLSRTRLQHEEDMRMGLRYTHRSGAIRPCRRLYYDDLHARPEQGWKGCQESTGESLGRIQL